MDALGLARELLRFDTINPPGDEEACARHLGRLLEGAGFTVASHEFAPRRTSLVARLGGPSGTPPLCFTGHVDTVPLGARPWRCDPFTGETAHGRLYGRGSSDMKSGVAAFVVAAPALAPKLRATPGLVLVITAGEETGAQGALHLARLGGALWLHAKTSGVTAHGSMPERGVLNVGTVHGGLNINSVPDAATVGVDIRTIPEQKHGALVESLAEYLGDEVTLADPCLRRAADRHPRPRRAHARPPDPRVLPHRAHPAGRRPLHGDGAPLVPALSERRATHERDRHPHR